MGFQGHPALGSERSERRRGWNRASAGTVRVSPRACRACPGTDSQLKTCVYVFRGRRIGLVQGRLRPIDFEGDGVSLLAERSPNSAGPRQGEAKLIVIWVSLGKIKEGFLRFSCSGEKLQTYQDLTFFYLANRVREGRREED
jgi:hypothetical protein